jgi:hypothetical protein
MGSGLSFGAVYFRRMGTNRRGEECVIEFEGMSGMGVPGTSGCIAECNEDGSRGMEVGG